VIPREVFYVDAANMEQGTVEYYIAKVQVLGFPVGVSGPFMDNEHVTGSHRIFKAVHAVDTAALIDYNQFGEFMVVFRIIRVLGNVNYCDEKIIQERFSQLSGVNHVRIMSHGIEAFNSVYTKK
jgi:hypothetical protein